LPRACRNFSTAPPSRTRSHPWCDVTSASAFPRRRRCFLFFLCRLQQLEVSAANPALFGQLTHPMTFAPFQLIFGSKSCPGQLHKSSHVGSYQGHDVVLPPAPPSPTKLTPVRAAPGVGYFVTPNFCGSSKQVGEFPHALAFLRWLRINLPHSGSSSPPPAVGHNHPNMFPNRFRALSSRVWTFTGPPSMHPSYLPFF